AAASPRSGLFLKSNELRHLMAKTTSHLIALLAFVYAYMITPLLHAQVPGTLVSVAGGGGLTAGPALSSALPDIGSLAQDGHGNGYGASRITCVVYKYDTLGNISVFAGNGVCNSAGDGGPATQASLSAPISVAVDAQANVYVADLTAHVVREI